MEQRDSQHYDEGASAVEREGGREGGRGEREREGGKERERGNGSSS